jgi:hypothetical protein
MPELHQILGSLFSDIAQSVFTSDLYSRDISRYYEQDGLLRHFPVPRTEISELEVELKFAIAGIELNPTQSIGREANAATLFIDFSYTLSESFYEALHETLVDLKGQNKPIDDTLLSQAASQVNAIYLRQDLLRYFQRDQGSLMVEGKFQVEKAQREIRDILRKHLDGLLGEGWTDRDKKDVFDRVSRSLKLESGLKALEEPLRYAWNRAGDFKVDVEITAGKLSELNSEQLSSVHIRTRVRNYKWSEVEHQDRRWWTLNPE